MTEFHTPIARVEKCETHPDEGLDHLSVITVLGKKCISGNLETGGPRYPASSLALFCPINSIIPVGFLKFQGFYWDAEKDRGLLKGSKRNRVGAVTRGSVTSEGLLFPLSYEHGSYVLYKGEGMDQVVAEGDYMEEWLGITEFKG